MLVIDESVVKLCRLEGWRRRSMLLPTQNRIFHGLLVARAAYFALESVWRIQVEPPFKISIGCNVFLIPFLLVTHQHGQVRVSQHISKVVITEVAWVYLILVFLLRIN